MESQSSRKENKNPDNIEMQLIAIGKKTGLSMMEINEFSVQELINYVNAYTGKEDGRPRMATQEDIDRFYA